MRVLFVNQTAEVSGAERSFLDLLAELDGEVERVVACPDGELADAVEALSVDRRSIAGTVASFRLHPVHTLRGIFDIARSAFQLIGLESRVSPTVVHANTTRSALLAMAPAPRRPPLLSHIRDWVPDGRLPRAVLAMIARRSDQVVANSAFVAAQFDGMRLRRPVVTVHNPVDLDRFAFSSEDGRSMRGELGIPGEARVLSCVAQVTPWKGQDDAIRSLAGLGTDRDVVLLLVGSAKFSKGGTRYDNVAFERGLRTLAEDLGVADRVRFLGERDDVPAVLSASDILLVPSWREAFGRIVVEGMAVGLPVIATSVGGPREIIEDRVDGVLLPPREPERWAAEIERLFDTPAELVRLGTAARGRSRDFSSAAHAASMLGIYREISVAPAGGL